MHEGARRDMSRNVPSTDVDEGQYVKAGFGQGDGVLEVRRHRPVEGLHRPLIRHLAHIGRAEYDHRFDRKNESGPQTWGAPTRDHIGDIRVLMKGRTNAVPGVATD